MALPNLLERMKTNVVKVRKGDQRIRERWRQGGREREKGKEVGRKKEGKKKRRKKGSKRKRNGASNQGKMKNKKQKIL